MRFKNQSGVTTVEYAIMLVLVAVAVLAFGDGLANSIKGTFSTITAKLTDAAK